MSKHLYMADVRFIRRQLVLVESQLALYEARPDTYGAALRVCLAACPLRAASERAELAMRRWDRAVTRGQGAVE